MDLICPACGKKSDSANECVRCGCELSILKRIIDAADKELSTGRECLGKGDYRGALHYARNSWRLRKSPEAARFAFVAALAAGDFEQAGIWYERSDTPMHSIQLL